VVLNGIVENYRELREELRDGGHVFTSETDAETVTHLIEEHYDGDLVEATRLAFNELEGQFAFVVIHRNHPESSSAPACSARWLVGPPRGRRTSPRNAARGSCERPASCSS
jgi:glucosamine--fructose-6-phosphate aminotransferase (isomerizing)